MRAILIAGPTASGKSGLAMKRAMRLAGEAGGIVVNADSMQVYRDLRILTARPSAEDEARVPHRLYGHVEGAEAYSVACWLDDVADVLRQAGAAGQCPILVGGTGLYFTSLLNGLSPIPDIPDDIRDTARARVREIGPEAFHAELARIDPEMSARLPATDPQRLARAYEVKRATGRSLADWQARPGQPILTAAETRRIVLAPDRAELHRRIERRFDLMLEQGALDEAAAFGKLGLSEDLPVTRALGLRPLLAHLAGEIDLATARERAIAETRQYAKRQETWFRNQFPDWQRVGLDGAEAITATRDQTA